MCIFLGQKKYGIWGDFSEKFQVLCQNPDEVTRFDGKFTMFKSVFRIHKFLGLPDLDTDLLVTGMDQDPSIIKQK